MQPTMTPAPGERWQRFVGDTVRFEIKDQQGRRPAAGWRALLRTNLGRGQELRREILKAHTAGLPVAGQSWRDIPMHSTPEGWRLDLPLVEPGFFKAKAYLADAAGWQHWPDGPDFGLSVHPDRCRTANILYCAFPRLFGPYRNATGDPQQKLEPVLQKLDEASYCVIPPSGKLRDLTRELPHIFDRLGCRILHLLPINPTPTTYARFGRFGSPYAALDLVGIDPALVVFDKRSTGVEQFRELTYAAHCRGGRVFLDIVINHTGWGSAMQERQPDWFLRGEDGEFASPGAWGITWEDLVEIKHQNVELWDELAEALLTWCRRGVDGFRCDAGYKVPVAAWQYIIARVQQEYPETIFLLEGLGGAWEATEALLTDGGMQWAYSELFQNYSALAVAGYLDHALRQSRRVGLLVHYSETHDNDRLAGQARAWSLLRNRLCALASISGGFGFTCGVEWLAKEKIRVHGSAGLSWDSPENIIPEMSRLNRLLQDHPCFFDGASLIRLSAVDSPVYALRRDSAEGADSVLVLVNTDLLRPQSVKLAAPPFIAPGTPAAAGEPGFVDLLGQKLPEMKHTPGAAVVFTLGPAAVYCLGSSTEPAGLSGEAYRQSRARAAWALQCLSRVLPMEQIPPLDWRELARRVDESPAAFLSAIQPANGLPSAPAEQFFPNVVTWRLLDARRVTLVPPAHWLLVEDIVPFRASLLSASDGQAVHLESIAAGNMQVVAFSPGETPSAATLLLERYPLSAGETGGLLPSAAAGPVNARGEIGFLPVQPMPRSQLFPADHLKPNDLVLLTNGRGGMCRLRVELGRVESKYDCVLGANLHPTLPVDRHVLVKRLRVWINADGFISPLDFQSLRSFSPGPPARWEFVANAGDGRTVQIELQAEMPEGLNTVRFQFFRPTARQASGKQLPPEADVRLTVRLDLEDRDFHCETHRNSGAEHHFSAHTRVLQPLPAGAAAGFVFEPSPERRLRAWSSTGVYHSAPEWSENVPHPIEASRGQPASGDAYSPGWFDLALPKGAEATLTMSAEPDQPNDGIQPPKAPPHIGSSFGRPEPAALSFEHRLELAARAFVVRRDQGKTVIAGYPWFLDWGRDTFIAARGLLAAGWREEVEQIVRTFARFEDRGTLPNTIFGEHAGNRDTSDAPLWFGVVCEELESAAIARDLLPILQSIATNYIQGTPNGIKMDPASALIWSPSHFTWMDTNYPPGTPREGYPVEIQALWVRFLKNLSRLDPGQSRWKALADQALAAIEQFFWIEEKGWYADVLRAGNSEPAAKARVDDALRSNALFLISLSLVKGQHARRCVEAAREYLLVPGALRSLAPLPVSLPLPIHSADGRLLNNPAEPYWGRYEGDEDSRRKPAYHNGTAWTWTLPTFCEALARAWDFDPQAVAAAKAYLGSMGDLLDTGCLGQLPEIMDGDAPHTPRGCDAQAWSATEALRVCRLLR
jgi:starch synthase (maltosyl-transferring)